MVYDMYGKEIKIGDDILYPTSAGAGSGQIRQYTVVRIDERQAHQPVVRWSEANQRMVRDWEDVTIGRIIARPQPLSSDYPDHNYRNVPLTRSDRAVVVTGLDLSRRYGEPEVSPNE
jgi:hypothetical protein